MELTFKKKGILRKTFWCDLAYIKLEKNSYLKMLSLLQNKYPVL